MTLSILGLVLGLILLIVFTIKGMNLMIAGPVCALVVALCGEIPLYSDGNEINYFSGYMGGFSSFVKAWFLMFLFGSLFGKLMEDSGSAESLAKWIVGKVGMKHAAFAVVIACAVLTYGGVSVFIVAFAVYPMALSLFKQADIPRRFIPAALSFGSVTFTMTSAGSPEIQNWIPIKYLNTTPYAAWQVSLIVAIFMAIFGYLWLQRMIKNALIKGESFQPRITDPKEKERKLPGTITALIPLVVVVISSFFFHKVLNQNALVVSLLLGVLTCYFLNIKLIQNIGNSINIASSGALIAIGNTSAVVGFGAIARETPAFLYAVEIITKIPGNELFGAAVAVSVIAGLTGSASGGQSIALPLLAPHYTDLGVDPDQLHRVVAISSGAIDSLPHNGYVVTTIRAICGESHSDAYPAVGALTVIVPVIGTGLAILLFILGL